MAEGEAAEERGVWADAGPEESVIHPACRVEGLGVFTG